MPPHPFPFPVILSSFSASAPPLKPPFQFLLWAPRAILLNENEKIHPSPKKNKPLSTKPSSHSNPLQNHTIPIDLCTATLLYSYPHLLAPAISSSLFLFESRFARLDPPPSFSTKYKFTSVPSDKTDKMASEVRSASVSGLHYPDFAFSWPDLASTLSCFPAVALIRARPAL